MDRAPDQGSSALADSIAITNRFGWLVHLAVGTGIGVGTAVLIGWVFDVPVLKGILPGLPFMQPNTAVSIVLAGAALAGLGREGAGDWSHRIGWTLGALVAVIGLATLTEYVGPVDLGIDLLLFGDGPGLASPAARGRMALMTAMSFSCLGSALLFLDIPNHLARRTSQALALATTSFALLHLIGYAYGFRDLYRIGAYSSMALHTAFALFVLGVGTLAARPRMGLIRRFNADDAGGWLLRNLLPLVVVLPLLLGGLRVISEEAGLFNPRFSSAVLVLSNIAALMLLLWWSAGKLSDLDAERSRAERGMKEREEWLRTTLRSIGDAVIATDSNGRVTFMNPVAETLTGWSRVDAETRSLEDIFTIVDEMARQPVANPARQALGEGRIVGLANHTILIARDGMARVIDKSAAPIRLDGGTIIGSVLVFRDVTERRRQQAALRASQEQYQAILESITDAFVALGRDFRFTYVNRRAEIFLDRTRDDLMGKLLWEECAQTLGNDFERALRRVIGEGVSVTLEGFCVPHDRWYEFHIYPSPEGVSLYFRDVSERRRADAHLRASEERRRLALDAAELGAWNIESGSNTLTADERFRMIFQGSTAPMDREQAIAAIHPEDRERAEARVVESIRPDDPSPYVDEYRVVHPDGSIRWVFVKGRANFEPTGTSRLVSIDGTAADITDRKLGEQERERLVGQLREQDHRKDDFLATLAHELRNPLAPIRNSLQIMKLAGDDHRAIDEARTLMERQVSHMVRLIDDLMDVSRISQGKMELRRGRVDLAAILQAAIETSRPIVEQEGHELAVMLPERPIAVDADPTRLAQVFSNLINNAAKYTERGGRIALVAERLGTDVIVTVRDNGVGIPAAMVPEIFSMFTQIDRSLERSQGGLGIGLSLVKTIVEMHGGSVEARSGGDGLGSEFVVRMPTVEVDSPRADSPAARDTLVGSARSSRILVVDDNQDAARTLARLLRILGHETRTANDGGEAVEVAEEYRPELILLDIGLPILNGYDVARTIRDRPWGRDVAIVALTGWGQENDRLRSKEAGIDDHLVKPVDPEHLVRIVAGACGETPRT